MTYVSLIAIGLALGVGLAAFGSALGLGRATAAALESTARQPEAAGNIRFAFFVGGAFIEALTIYALFLGLVIWFTLSKPSVEQVLQLLK